MPFQRGNKKSHRAPKLIHVLKMSNRGLSFHLPSHHLFLQSLQGLLHPGLGQIYLKRKTEEKFSFTGSPHLMQRSGAGGEEKSKLSFPFQRLSVEHTTSSSRQMPFPREPGNRERGPLSIRRELASTCSRAGLAPSFRGVQELTWRALRTLPSTCGSPPLSSRRWGRRLASRPPSRRGCRLLWPRPLRPGGSCRRGRQASPVARATGQPAAARAAAGEPPRGAEPKQVLPRLGQLA